jgi:AcrR family transcriptional regulator
MGRRSDHTRSELEALFVDEGRRQLAETGLARFSARDVAKRVGYSIGTLYNVFGSYDGLMLAINGRTLTLWSAYLEDRLAEAGEDRIACLVEAYFEFATQNPKTWIAVYEHHMADGGPAPDWYQALAAELMAIVAAEIAAALPDKDPGVVLSLARSLVATVHGHCVFALYNTFSLLGETDPVGTALARVREAIAAARES